MSENLAYSISETPFVVYTFLFVLLIGIYIKLFVFKSLKGWLVMFIPIILSVCIFVNWLLQTGYPSEKLYTIDKQYSNYSEEFNYNKILNKFAPSYRWHGYKYYLFDEVEQEVLSCRVLYEWDYYAGYDWLDFREEENRFYFSRSDYYDLPRMIDKELLEDQARKYEKERQKIYIDKFMISPAERLIYGQYATGGTDVVDGKTYHWHGVDYAPAEDIDFNTTSLIFIGDRIFLKDFFPIRSVDILSLKVIDYSIGSDENTVTLLSPSEEKVYGVRKYGAHYSIDIKGYTHVSKVIFKDKSGKLFFIPYGKSELQEFDMPLDEESLKHVNGNYYTDKNGLYLFGSYFGGRKLEPNDGKINYEASLFERYFIYKNAAYPYKETHTANEFRLNADRLNKIILWGDIYLGDGEKLIKLPTGNAGSIKTFATSAEFIQTNTPPEPVNEWNNFDIIVVGHDNKGKTIYYPSKKMYIESGTFYSLIKTSGNFYGLTGSSERREAIKLKNVMIYNVDKEKYEPIEVDKFRRITPYFYVYKNRTYYMDSYPFETDIDISSLYPIKHNGIETKFYTDGKLLLGGDHLGEKNIEKRDGEIWYTFKEIPFQDVDWGSLQVVRQSMLIDKNNIYMLEYNSAMRIIPIKDIGIDVKVVEVLE